LITAADGDAASGIRTAETITVLVAHESSAFCTEVEKVLAQEPFTVLTCNDGKEALAIIERVLPQVVLVDVALPSLYGFQVCESVRNNPRTSGVKLVMIAAIYDKTKYKRSPQSLYGADDYIEKHHIPDALTGMIYRLVAEPEPAGSVEDQASTHLMAVIMPQQAESAELITQEGSRKALRDDEVRVTDVLPDRAAADVMHSDARRLARSIVSAISLYRQAEVEEGIRCGTFFQLLADAISDGRALYESRIPEPVRNSTFYLDEAFDDFINQKQQELICQTN